MPKSGLTGSRIRSRRLDLGLRQTELARSCGISASYLNLIEHNRRRIGGKLLVDIARTLGIEVSALSEGADRSLIEDLQGAADRIGLPEAGEAMEDLAGRYPDAARLVIEQARRIDELEGALETLSDRLAHDPHLAESLHDVLTTAAAIRSASAILAEEDVDPAWQARFHRNLHEDSRRLADASRALASYLEVGADASRTVLSPQEELHAWLDGMGFRLSWIEEGAEEAEDARRIAADDGPGSAAAQALARAHVAQYRRDAARMPEARVREILQEAGPDPARLAAEFGADFPAVFRRLAALAEGAGHPSVGLAVCDGSGAMVFRRPAEGFPLPLFGGACPLWPLYEAMARPGVPIRRTLELAGRQRRRFDSYTFAETRALGGFGGPLLTRSYMLVLTAAASADATEALVVGGTCRICVKADCAARREPTVIETEEDRALRIGAFDTT
jgi:transcriptional regulator with XRE-family HTH domain